LAFESAASSARLFTFSSALTPSVWVMKKKLLIGAKLLSGS